ncbi:MULTISPECIES: hypothetical protein [unclassified Frondihabitans]|uniref:hypothetical protein n=1 Tax=unclassified Frondihabitans TaxID=2626248 RepID=UPI000F4DF178|nr:MULTISPECIES: hypothetical protein [unclassified Frondihabitans]RPE74368.1 hypothetical protein EDF37_3109 [Frondihabitans sp. PhB153]RPF02797.1 hypothetical protein EDF39_3177 [Frondihabitans sp. PhB161]
MKSRAFLTLGPLAVTAALLLSGCGSALSPTGIDSNGTDSAPTVTSSASALGAGFYDPDKPPAPEGTLRPEPGSWDAVHPPAGYRVVLLSSGDDAATRTLVRSVKSWASSADVRVTPVVASSADDRLAAVTRAVEKKADLVISVGNAMVDPLAALSPSALHQQFLVLGAEIAEPTSNVTAADWTGAGFRGEGLGTPSHYDASTFTDERAGRALRAGIAAVLSDLNGTVVWVR